MLNEKKLTQLFEYSLNEQKKQGSFVIQIGMIIYSKNMIRI